MSNDPTSENTSEQSDVSHAEHLPAQISTDAIPEDQNLNQDSIPHPAAKPHKSGVNLLSGIALLTALGSAGYSFWIQQSLEQQVSSQLSNVKGIQSVSLEQVNQQITSALQTELAKQDQQTKAATTEVKNDLQAMQNNLKSMDLTNKDIATLRQELEIFKQAIKTDQTAANQLNNQQNTEIEQHQQALSSVHASIATLDDNLAQLKVIAIQGGDIYAMRLTEVHYLLRLSYYQATFEQNPALALSSMQTAIERLSTVEEKSFTETLAMMKRDALALSSVKIPNLADQSEKIAELSDRIDTLPLRANTELDAMKAKFEAEAAAKISPPKEENPTWWRALGNSAGNFIAKSFVVKHESIKTPELLSTSDRFFLVQNIKLQLESARNALLISNSREYTYSLERARNWLENYFAGDHDEVRLVIAELDALKRQQPDLVIPSLTATVKSFEAQLKVRESYKTTKGVTQ